MPNVRGRNEGTLFCRKRDRHWVAMVTMPDGRRRSASDPSKDVAVGLLRDLIDQRDRSVAQDPRRLRVGPYLKRWIADLTGLSPATMRQHEMIVRKHLIPAFGPYLLTSLSPADVDRYLASTTLDPQTLRHHRATLRRALADAVRDNLVSRNVAALSRPPRLHKAERRYLSSADVRRIILHGRDARLWPLHVVILATGLRVSEALGLIWPDIDLDARTLTVKRKLLRVNGAWAVGEPKTRRSRRTITLIPEAVEALHEQRRRQDAERGDYPRPIDALVFATPIGKPIHSTNVLPSWYRLLAELGLPRVTTHDCRHTTATLMLAAGVPIAVIAEILGHSSIRVTADLYAHITPTLRRDAADKLHEALS